MKKFLFLFFSALIVNSAFAQESFPADVVVTDLNKAEFNVSEQVKSNSSKGIISVVVLWASWNSPSKQELNLIHENLYASWKEKYNIELIAISLDDVRNQSRVKPYVAGKNWEYKVGLDSRGTSLTKLGGDKVIPLTLVVGTDHKIAFKQEGFEKEDEAKIEKVLASLSGNSTADANLVSREGKTLSVPDNITGKYAEKCSEADFQQLMSLIETGFLGSTTKDGCTSYNTTERSKMIFKYFVQKHAITVAQFAKLVDKLNDSKMELSKFAWFYCYDPENFPTLEKSYYEEERVQLSSFFKANSDRTSNKPGFKFESKKLELFTKGQFLARSSKPPMNSNEVEALYARRHDLSEEAYLSFLKDKIKASGKSIRVEYIRDIIDEYYRQYLFREKYAGEVHSLSEMHSNWPCRSEKGEDELKTYEMMDDFAKFMWTYTYDRNNYHSITSQNMLDFVEQKLAE